MARTYTVKKGDSLWAIAASQLGSGNQWKYIADLNGISQSRPIIYPGQVLKLEAESSGGGGSSGGGTTTPTPTPPPPVVPETSSARPVIAYFGLQAGTDRTVFVAWNWSKANTKNFQIRWYYDTGNGVWFLGSETNTSDGLSESEYNATYSAPDNAKAAKCKIKALSTSRNVNNQNVEYWTAQWSTEAYYNFSNNPPKQPPTPNISIKDYKLTTSVTGVGELNANEIQFEIVKNDNSVFKTGKVSISTSQASFSCTVDAGAVYKVRARSFRGSEYSDWSEYSSNAGTKPASPRNITKIRASSETSVYLAWNSVYNAKSYEIEYTTKREYFNGSDQTTTVSNITNPHYEKTGLESGNEYFFRVRAVNDNGSSAWSDISSVIVGKTPSAPTTWSSTTTAITGEPLDLYWIHNAEDGSSQTYAEIELYVNNVKETHTINSTKEDDEHKTTSYTINTSKYTEGTIIKWRVRTAGITKVYSNWSIQRTVDIYAPPTLMLGVTDINGANVTVLESFPINVTAIAGPNTQTPISYHLSIIPKESYETIDNTGNVRIITKGEEIYSNHFDISSRLSVSLSAGDVDLENNVEYRIICVVSMNSGLTAEASSEFKVLWTDEEYTPNAEMGLDVSTMTMSIRPYCDNEHGELIENVMLSVYRREYDGSFTELATEVDNVSNTFIIDPHPALDFARYRIVAISKVTGAVSYYDMPGYPVSEKSVIIQWDEKWSSFNSINEDLLEEAPYVGSILKIMYNIDVSESYKSESSLVEYIGRKHPVSYYGTQQGETSSWKMEIPKKDKDTLYALRRLAKWMGDVYVREPSGIGYWANITVSFSQTHCKPVIPITLDVTRVEGGA